MKQEDDVLQHMVQWIERIPTGPVDTVKGQIEKPDQPVTGTTKHDVEILIRELHVVARCPQAIPFTLQEDEISKDKKIGRGQCWKLHHRTRQMDSPHSQRTNIDIRGHVSHDFGGLPFYFY